MCEGGYSGDSYLSRRNVLCVGVCAAAEGRTKSTGARQAACCIDREGLGWMWEAWVCARRTHTTESPSPTTTYGCPAVVLLARDTPPAAPGIRELNIDMSQWQPLIEDRAFVSWLVKVGLDVRGVGVGLGFGAAAAAGFVCPQCDTSILAGRGGWLCASVLDAGVCRRSPTPPPLAHAPVLRPQPTAQPTACHPPPTRAQHPGEHEVLRARHLTIHQVTDL